MPTTRELQAQLVELTEAVEKLITHVEVLALAVRKRGSVPQADLDELLKGIGELRSLGAERRRGMGIDDPRTRDDGDEGERKKKPKKPSVAAKKATKAAPAERRSRINKKLAH
jgi:hypothetical protein